MLAQFYRPCIHSSITTGWSTHKIGLASYPRALVSDIFYPPQRKGPFTPSRSGSESDKQKWSKAGTINYQRKCEWASRHKTNMVQNGLPMISRLWQTKFSHWKSIKICSHVTLFSHCLLLSPLLFSFVPNVTVWIMDSMDDRSILSTILKTIVVIKDASFKKIRLHRPSKLILFHLRGSPS